MIHLPTIPPNKEFKRFCFSLRCPLCGAQLDGNIHPRAATLYCVSDNAEYNVFWLAGSEEPEWEKLIYHYDDYDYYITCSKKLSVIYRVHTDIHPVQRSNPRYHEEVLRIEARLSFFRHRMSKKEFVKKLKLYNVFS